MIGQLNQSEKHLASTVWNQLKQQDSKAQLHLLNSPQKVREAILEQLVVIIDKGRKGGKTLKDIESNPFD
ncbi:MAG: hypothetical protein EOP04_07645 [Proteobacteria bacterium]|nr:MAG: hypothetical protein EOP04_07645 [Pseudomonadota bacterium]